MGEFFCRNGAILPKSLDHQRGISNVGHEQYQRFNDKCLNYTHLLLEFLTPGASTVKRIHETSCNRPQGGSKVPTPGITHFKYLTLRFSHLINIFLEILYNHLLLNNQLFILSSAFWELAILVPKQCFQINNSFDLGCQSNIHDKDNFKSNLFESNSSSKFQQRH